jgi:hypothetical protein
MAPQPIAGAEEEEDSSYSVDGDDSSAAAATPLLNLRFYPSGGSDEEDTVEKLLFEDAHEGDDDSDVHFVMSSREKVVKFADERKKSRRIAGKDRSIDGHVEGCRKGSRCRKGEAQKEGKEPPQACQGTEKEKSEARERFGTNGRGASYVVLSAVC